MIIKLKKGFILIFFVIDCTLAFGANFSGENPGHPLKVDFDFSGRKVEEVNDPEYKSWVINEGSKSEKTFGELSIELQGNFRSNWYKAGIQAPYYARLVNDGIVTSENLTMTINGLKAGTHSLLTFHNTFDSPESSQIPNVTISVDRRVVRTLKPSTRVNSTIEAAMAYIHFDVEEGQSVIIEFSADHNSNTENKEITINGFELDGENLKLQARNPFPENNDEHVVAEEKLTLKWESPDGSTTSQVYFGDSEEAVKKATSSSGEYQGDVQSNIFNVSDLYSYQTYYWRIDEINEKGETTKGNVWSFKPAQLAFPGAEGYGRFAIGGRGGKVVYVTNLNDSGPGSFRDAVENDIGPRTILFNVSGKIELQSRLVINQKYITVAGQTAPGKGITISRAPVGLTGDDGIMRFVRVRLGSGKTFDGMGLTGANHSIIDHCSISWTIDEAFSSRGAHNITLQNTLISEALNVAGHSKYEDGKMHGFAATIGGSIGSFHHNLLAHNYGRNWSIGGGIDGNGYYTGKIDIRNNVVYNWGHRATDGGANQVNFVNNYYKPGPATDFFYALNAQHEGVGLGKQQYYFAGNIMTGHFDESNQKDGRKHSISNGAIVDYETFLNEPFFEHYVTTQPAEEAYKIVLSDVGANQPLDDHDKRIIQETIDSTFTFTGEKSGLGGMIDTEQDVGGWEDYPEIHREANFDTDKDGLPNWWENAKNLNPNSPENDFSDSNADTDLDGFTALEDYLNWLAKPHHIIEQGETLTISAADLFKGFTESPVYSIDEGTATIENGEIKFNGNQSGFQTIKISVKDAKNHSMQRTMNIYVN